MLRRKVKELKKIHRIQKQTIETNADDYMVGLYNGLEMAVAILESREPVFETSIREHEIKRMERMEEGTGRTIASGIKRR